MTPSPLSSDGINEELKTCLSPSLENYKLMIYGRFYTYLAIYPLLKLFVTLL